jgi:hypothetical protein
VFFFLQKEIPAPFAKNKAAPFSRKLERNDTMAPTYSHCFCNNRGGVGKTFMAFQSACEAGRCTLTPPDPWLKRRVVSTLEPCKVKNRFQDSPFDFNLHRYSEAARARPDKKVLVFDFSLYSDITALLLGGSAREGFGAPMKGLQVTVVGLYKLNSGVRWLESRLVQPLTPSLKGAWFQP